MAKGEGSATSCNFDNLVDCMSFAIDNIVRYGDTDIFPFPVERLVIRDNKAEVLKLLIAISKDFDASLREMPIESERLLQAVGYTGFRQGTFIDPLWNSYLLGLVLHVGSDIEAARLNVSKEAIFSYRFHPDVRQLRK
jgi:hypothetical protein